MQKYDIDYLDENYYKKLERAVKKYNMIAFKKLNFGYYPSFREGKFEGRIILSNKEKGITRYELKLPTDIMFSKVHGEIKLIYSVDENKKIVLLEKLLPEDILLEGHHSELSTYKGIKISKENASKDMFKIDLLNIISNDKK